MLKRINWSAILKGSIWIVCLSGLVVLMSFIEVKKQDLVCTNVKILIPGADNFIERDEIDGILKQGYGQLRGKNMNEINIHSIEERIRANPYIAFVKVYAEMDGQIIIRVRQRQPVLRVINSVGQDFYLDNEGYKMPVSANFTANVLVANGNIQEPFSGRIEKISSKMLQDLYQTALYIKADTLWNAQIEQLYVDEKADIELIPRVGNQNIIIGSADMLDVKMQNLLVFYKKVMPKVGWDTYKTINVKFLNQIVCEKNSTVGGEKIAVKADSNVVDGPVRDSIINATIKKELLSAAAKETEPEQVIKVTNSKPVTDKKQNLGNENAETEKKKKQDNTDKTGQTNKSQGPTEKTSAPEKLKSTIKRT